MNARTPGDAEGDDHRTHREQYAFNNVPALESLDPQQRRDLYALLRQAIAGR
ncbi:hypothetical protein GFY24_12140 [Nocardia sp. SYP-A9097]|uniref:hypothetical protein n=1 Tax=Nocardia sp. SYP-A9097 TaxID=2663237 RepID=UPI00129B90AD|nr:hypothetical protein [Nocardia sp. SYP-A9097]MRH88184.1 hypothetical protein [Nocardia sp. SYP-A9097]